MVTIRKSSDTYPFIATVKNVFILLSAPNLAPLKKRCVSVL